MKLKLYPIACAILLFQILNIGSVSAQDFYYPQGAFGDIDPDDIHRPRSGRRSTLYDPVVYIDRDFDSMPGYLIASTEPDPRNGTSEVMLAAMDTAELSRLEEFDKIGFYPTRDLDNDYQVVLFFNGRRMKGINWFVREEKIDGSEETRKSLTARFYSGRRDMLVRFYLDELNRPTTSELNVTLAKDSGAFITPNSYVRSIQATTTVSTPPFELLTHGSGMREVNTLKIVDPHPMDFTTIRRCEILISKL